MAEHALIDTYVAEVRRALGRHRDVADLADEIADHLLTGARGWRERGFDADAAAQRSIAVFGDPALVARTYAAARRRGLAIPTRGTRAAGRLLVVSGAVFVVALILLLSSTVVERTHVWEGWPQTLYMVGVWPLWFAGMLLVVGLVGVHRRHGGGRRSSVLGLALLALGAVLSLAPWFVFAWIPALAAGAVVFATWLRQRDLAPRLPVRLLAAGPVAAVCVVGVAAVYGGAPTMLAPDWHLASEAAVSGGLAVFVAGVVGLGRWLATEQPIDDPQQALVP